LVLCAFNISAPPSLNFLGELSLIFSSIRMLGVLYLMGRIFLFLSGVYSIYAYVIFIHGRTNAVFKLEILRTRDIIVYIFHILPIFLLFLRLEILN
jgi:NADH-ubiquinone oxidoreductase chain 4